MSLEDGDCYGLHYDNCLECLMSPYVDPWAIPCFDDCKNGAFEGWCLATSDVYSY